MLSLEEFRIVRGVAEEVFRPLGLNPVDNLLVSLLGEKQLTLKPQAPGLPERIRIKCAILIGRLLFPFRVRNLKSEVRRASFVFFLTEPTHHRQCFPIARALKEQNGPVLVIATKESLLADWIKLQIPGFYLDLRNVTINAESIRKASTLNARFAETAMVKDKMRENLSGRVLTSLPTQLRMQKFIAALQNGDRRKWWIIGNDLSLLGRAAATTLKRSGNKVATIQHGTIPEDPIHAEHLADTVMVFGETAKNRLLQLGIEPGRIEVTGAPYLDSVLRKNRDKEQQVILEFLDLDTPFEKRILVAFSGAGQRTSEKHHLQMIDAVLRLADQFREYLFIIKLHRKDKAAYYESHPLFNQLTNIRLGYNLPARVSGDIFDWLALVPVMFTGNSAAGAEACIMRKLVFTVDFLNEYRGVDYVDAGASIHNKSFDELQDNFRKYSVGEIADMESSRDKFVMEYYDRPDGISSERCAKVLRHER